jgi:hypothetical protein
MAQFASTERVDLSDFLGSGDDAARDPLICQQAILQTVLGLLAQVESATGWPFAQRGGRETLVTVQLEPDADVPIAPGINCC